MDFSQFHFAQAAWLWGLLAIPVVSISYFLAHRAEAAELLERFADRHLLVHLLKNSNLSGRSIRIPLLLWSAAWVFGVLAMAGPRWSYVDQQTFRVAEDLVIVLDLSQSMDATDVKPSRIARARNEIQDILNMSHGTSIGLIAYAAVPHMVTPLTDDVRTIKNLLPALDTSLVTIQGDRLKPALEMAARMLKAEPGRNKSILVIGDGGFQEKNIAELARAAGGATIYAMGIGTPKGAPVGSDSRAAGKPKISRLQADRLRLLARSGNGLYIEADYTNDDTRAVLSRVEAGGDAGQATAKVARLWNERFYVPALFLALLLLPLFRRGAAFPAVLLLAAILLPSGHAQASTFVDFFRNQNQQARAAYESGDYKTAFAKFDTPYRRGVVAYRAKDYAKAALLFGLAAKQKASLDATYNLGNAQLMQYQPEDAIVSYKTVLKQRPGDVAARHNLAIAEAMLKKNKEQKKDQKRQPPKDEKNKDKQNNGGGQSKQQNQKQPQQEKGGKQQQQKQQGSPQNQQKSGTQNKQKAKPQNGQPQNGQPQGGKGQAQKSGGNQEAAARQAPAQKQAGAAKQQAVRESRFSQGKSGQGKSGDAQKMRGVVSSGPPRRTPLDVNADEWLNRVQNDPGSFLKNQFMIEDQASGLKQGTQPR